MYVALVIVRAGTSTIRSGLATHQNQMYLTIGWLAVTDMCSEVVWAHPGSHFGLYFDCHCTMQASLKFFGSDSITCQTLRYLSKIIYSLYLVCGCLQLLKCSEISCLQAVTLWTLWVTCSELLHWFFLGGRGGEGRLCLVDAFHWILAMAVCIGRFERNKQWARWWFCFRKRLLLHADFSLVQDIPEYFFNQNKMQCPASQFHTAITCPQPAPVQTWSE